ncbi:hypothetical protein ACVWXO_008613 [Bradyrhizobium sp. LM2.7]
MRKIILSMLTTALIGAPLRKPSPHSRIIMPARRQR